MQCNLRISLSIVLDGDKNDNKSDKGQSKKYIPIGFSNKGCLIQGIEGLKT